MPEFHYQARDNASKSYTGTTEAENQAEVAKYLIDQGLIPVKITEKAVSLRSLLKVEVTVARVKTDDMTLFCRQMYSMVRAGVSLLDTLQKLAEATRSTRLREVIYSVQGEVARGRSLSDSIAHFPKIFPPTFISIIEAGEKSGQLENALLQLSDFFEREARMRKQIKTATRYPKLVIGALIAAFVVMNYLIIPAFVDMFKSMKMQLPLVTRILIATSNFMTHNGVWLALFLIALGFGVWRYLKTEKGRYFWDRLKLKMPIFGPILQRAMMARFARTFTMMVRSGVPLVQGIHLLSNTMNNSYMKQEVNKMEVGIRHGDSLAKTLAASGVFTNIAVQMVSVGERSGSLDNMLEEVALYYEREVDYDLKKLGDMIEPILLLIMGGMVLVLALGIFLPMFNITNLLHK